MTAIVINYNIYWLIISAIIILAGTLIFGVPLWGIWYEMRRERKENEALLKYVNSDDEEKDTDDWEVDDLYDKRVKP